MRINLVQLPYATIAKNNSETVLNTQSSTTYLKTRKYCLGVINRTRFKGTTTNALVFDMKELGVNLDTKLSLEDRKENELDGQKKVVKVELPFIN